MSPETSEREVEEQVKEYKRERGTPFVSRLERCAIAEGLLKGRAEGEAKGLARGLSTGHAEGRTGGPIAALRQAMMHV